MSLNIVPPAGHATTYSHLQARSAGAPSAPGLHDTLRAGLGPAGSADEVVSTHPLEARLRAWEATQESLRMETLRRAFGVAEPVRRGMELRIACDGDWRPALLGPTPGGRGSVHEDILRGRDATITWEDVFTGEERRPVVGPLDEMEKKLKM